jgi:hypothetical protein
VSDVSDVSDVSGVSVDVHGEDPKTWLAGVCSPTSELVGCGAG